jgi:hypothetical protein
MATGIGALLAGVAIAGIWIYTNWAGLGAFFTGFWEGFREALGPAAPMLHAVAEAVKGIWEWLGNLLGPLDANQEQWTSWGHSAGEALGGFITKLSDWTGINGEVLASIAALYAGFSVLKLIWWLPAAPIIAAGQLLASVGKGPLKRLLKGMRLLGKAFFRLGILALTNPIALIIGSVAALAYAVYDNWDKIVSAITEKVEIVRAAFDEGLIKGVFKLLAEFNPFTLAVEGAIGLVAYVMELLGVPDQIIAKFKEFSLFATGVTLMKSLWDGMASIVDAVVTYIVDKFKSLKPAWLTDLQDWVSGSEDTPAAQANPRSGQAKPRVRGTRDHGGPVMAGLSYLIGERAPEVFVPNVAGNILPTRFLKAAMAASTLAAPAAAMPTSVEIEHRIDQSPAMAAKAGRAGQAPQVIRQGDTISIHIAPPHGTDEQEIARLVMRELSRRENDRRADLHDGVDY